MSGLVQLDPASIEAVARRVAEILLEEGEVGGSTPPAGELLTAAEVARRHGVDRSWVYANAERLGAVRLGEGPRPRLRFDPERVAAALGACSTGRRAQTPAEAAAEPKQRRARKVAMGTNVELLPIRGETSVLPRGGRAA